MDQEIANTLGELERKLRELERVLSGIGRSAAAGDAPPPAPAAPSAAAAAAPAAAAPETVPPAAWLTHRPGASRVVDEAVEELGSAC